jgi:two-component system, chemotaxis family, chemotaxis protein CheY
MRTVLIVDDTEVSATAMEMACSSIPGVEVRSVSSALEAVRLLRNGDRSIAVVVTDLQMPGMDGFELIRFIRSEPKHKDLPIIVVTADTDPAAPERALRLGANAWFGKPFSPAALRRQLEQLLEASTH